MTSAPGKPTGDVMQRAIALLREAGDISSTWVHQKDADDWNKKRDALLAEIEPIDHVARLNSILHSGRSCDDGMGRRWPADLIQAALESWSVIRSRLAASTPAAIDEDAIRKDERARTERELLDHIDPSISDYTDGRIPNVNTAMLRLATAIRSGRYRKSSS